MSKFLYAHIDAKNGCYQHRILWPYSYLVQDHPELDFDLSMTDPIGKYDYYLTHGSPPLSNYLYIGKWKRGGGKWILSIDDDYFDIPEGSPARMSEEALDLFSNSYDLADIIIVSTNQLFSAVNRPKKTLVAPNLMKVDDYGVDTVAVTNPGEPLRVLWAGSNTHGGDFVDAEPAINEILKKWKGKVEFLFMGYCPGNLMRDWLGRGVHYEQGCNLALYPKVLKQMRPHITIAPLADRHFNWCKSNIRVLEGWSLASAVVASAVGEYNCVQHGVDGLLATNSGQWFEMLNKLLSDRELRETLATNGRKRVAAQYDWENAACRQPWRDMLNQLIARR